MSPELRAALVAEQFGTPTPEWHPGMAWSDQHQDTDCCCGTDEEDQ